MLLGSVASIWRYPVKSLHFEALDAVDVEASGLRGDRTAAYFVASPDRPRFGKEFRGKENDTLHRLFDGPDVLAAARGARVDVERREGDRFFDAAPISILFDRWLESLSEHVGYAVEPLRFRPNFYAVATPEYGELEPSLIGRTLTVGAVSLCVRKPIERCAVPTYDLHGGPSDPRVLRFIAQQRENAMGIYCDVVAPGLVRVGDPISSS